MNKNVKLVMSISDICIAYSCLALVTCAVGCVSYKIGQTKTRFEIVSILNEYLNNTRIDAD